MYKYTYFYGLKTSYLSISAARPARFSFYSLGQSAYSLVYILESGIFTKNFIKYKIFVLFFEIYFISTVFVVNFVFVNLKKIFLGQNANFCIIFLSAHFL